MADAGDEAGRQNSEPEATGDTMGKMSAQVYGDTQETVTEELISERRLWTAVLVHAVEDWRKGTLRARREAQDFLFQNDKDFEMVCSGAGLEGSDFRARLLRVGCKVPMEGRVQFGMAA
jgi:hypothetical protein